MNPAAVPLAPALAPEPALRARVSASLARLEARLGTLAPALGPALSVWMRALAGGRDPASYFLHPDAFPTLALPGWLDASLGGATPPGLLDEITYSSIAGYYLIRLIDDVTDGDDPAARRLLPAVGILHAEFQGAYARFFPAGHPFWGQFYARWAACQEAAWADAGLDTIDAATFARVCAQKVSAATIPLLAICHARQRGDLPAPWQEFFAALSRWHQMHNDLFDWKRDADAGTTTYFLSEGARRRQQDESLLSWVAREGFAWGCGRLEVGLAEMERAGRATGSEALCGYLAGRRARLATTRAAAEPGLAILRTLAGSA